MKRPPGFSLVEMAIVIAVIGLLASLVLPGLLATVRRDRTSEARATLLAVRDEVIGYALAHERRLPAGLAALGNPVDPWKQAIGYTAAENIVTGSTDDICSATTTANTVVTAEDRRIRDVAFVISSAGQDFRTDVATGMETDLGGKGDDLVQYVTLPHLRTLMCAPAHAEVSDTEITMDDFAAPGNYATVESEPGLGAIVDQEAGTVTLGVPRRYPDLQSYGCVWYTGTTENDACVDGKCAFGGEFRAYFEFSVENISSDVEDGFTLSLISARDNSPRSCGGYGAAVGYASTSFRKNGFDDGAAPFVLPPKIGVEIDLSSTKDNNDPTGACNSDGCHHLGILYWGSDAGDTALERGQDDCRHRFTPSTPDPEVPDHALLDEKIEFRGRRTYPVRVEIKRATGGDGNGIYTVHAWFDCTDCDNLGVSLADRALNAGKHVTDIAAFPRAWHERFDRVMFGWTQGTGHPSQEVLIKNARFRFLSSAP